MYQSIYKTKLDSWNRRTCQVIYRDNVNSTFILWLCIFENVWNQPRPTF